MKRPCAEDITSGLTIIALLVLILSISLNNQGDRMELLIKTLELRKQELQNQSIERDTLPSWDLDEDTLNALRPTFIKIDTAFSKNVTTIRFYFEH